MENLKNTPTQDLLVELAKRGIATTFISTEILKEKLKESDDNFSTFSDEKVEEIRQEIIDEFLYEFDSEEFIEEYIERNFETLIEEFEN